MIGILPRGMGVVEWADKMTPIIIDNGSGMSEETLRHLFEPFFTTKDVGKGTGLGLATARSIVRDHRGEMIVQSTLNKGSTFIVLLPLSTGTEEKK